MADILPFPELHSAMPASMLADSAAAPRVLVIDDEPAIRGVVCEFFRDCGLDPVAAGNADDAVQLMDGGLKPDLVFSDVRMPGSRDGYGLARWVMENRPGLPVILVTGDLGKANEAPWLRNVETFAKPYDFDMAVKKIRDTIARRRQKAG